MTEPEWKDSTDAGAMLEFLWQQEGISSAPMNLRSGSGMSDPATLKGNEADLERALHRFYVASCRRIWKLLPQEASRHGVEMAERYLAGEVSWETLEESNFEVEGAAFCIDYDTDPEAIEGWVAEVEALPATEMQRMLNPPEVANEIEPRELLMRAAYFVDYAMIYPSLSPKGPPPSDYWIFLSSELLREYISDPGRISGNGP